MSKNNTTVSERRRKSVIPWKTKASGRLASACKYVGSSLRAALHGIERNWPLASLPLQKNVEARAHSSSDERLVVTDFMCQQSGQ
jgi:hypothetical protein